RRRTPRPRRRRRPLVGSINSDFKLYSTTRSAREVAVDADEAVEVIQREMTVFARRARASAGRMHPELSLVSYTLLGHLEESGGCRATDLAAHYALDKSTVSRQVAALEQARLIERRLDPDDHRVQVLHLTEAGRQILA